MSQTSLRIHPAIGIARVGNSEEYYIGPETMAGMDLPGTDLTGGLPIKPGTENRPIDSEDLRDQEGRLKRQAARFRVYLYQFEDITNPNAYPARHLPADPASEGASDPASYGVEVLVGSQVDGKTVTDIIWTVHLANKKANSWRGGGGVEPFKKPAPLSVRNSTFGGTSDLADPLRLKKLVIDAGPRALSAASREVVRFDDRTQPMHGDAASGAIQPLPNYPVSFPASAPTKEGATYSQAIRSLGAITGESGTGRLLVLGGYGLACGFDQNGDFSDSQALDGDVNNDNWLDDTADGPVTAFLVFQDGSTRAVDGSAWVVSTDPSYAPQITNVVTLWDEVRTTWLENFNLQPSIYQNGQYQTSYQPDYATEVFPALRAASLQKWNVNLPFNAVKAHNALGSLEADKLLFPIMNYIRDPNDDGSASIGTPLMPLALGDEGKSFLSLSTSQYFFMSQWANGIYRTTDDSAPQALGPGEALDRAVLFNCLGGRFGPGIDLGFTVRDPKLYRRADNCGPFRLNMEALDYSKADKDRPFLGVGYVPLGDSAVQPGDVCKFMALPWHTDYNSCATHMPDPNPGGALSADNTDQASSAFPQTVNTWLYASWPAQRPVAVYTYQDVVANGGLVYDPDTPTAETLALVRQRFSVRGAGTAADLPGVLNPAQYVGRYQKRKDFLLDWSRIGVVLQAPAIVQKPGEAALQRTDYYLEVASRFEKDESNLSEYWRSTAIDKLYPPEN